MKYNPKTFTWGYELEFGDISRSTEIPDHLGAWEYNETDIVNIFPPYKGIACDPLGIDPPVGGEINTKPTKTRDEQVNRISEIIELFRKLGQEPTTSVMSAGHIHVHVPGFRCDLQGLKNLVSYIKRNQKHTIEVCARYPADFDNKSLLDIFCTTMPDKLCDIIIKKAKKPLDVFKLRPVNGVDSFYSERPLRPAINFYNLLYVNTVEFRCFHSTTNLREISDSLLFVEKFMSAALNSGPNVEQILKEYDYQFAPTNYDHQLYLDWEKTKYKPFTRGLDKPKGRFKQPQ